MGVFAGITLAHNCLHLNFCFGGVFGRTEVNKTLEGFYYICCLFSFFTLNNLVMWWGLFAICIGACISILFIYLFLNVGIGLGS